MGGVAVAPEFLVRGRTAPSDVDRNARRVFGERELRPVRPSYTDGADTVAIYRITSTATSGAPNEVDYVERQIQASFSK